ncbi:MAG: radical SAM protein, partial [Candidatus Methylomirabilia bacterium]
MRGRLRGKFCSRPFEWLEIQGRVASFCCPGWVRGGNVSLEGRSVREVWNGPEAQALRASILDGTFRFCLREECPFMNQRVERTWESGGPPFRDQREVTDGRLLRIIDRRATILEDGPLTLNCGYDRTCTLSCPSCRREPIALGAQAAAEIEQFQDRILDEIGPGLHTLHLAGTGDPFASRIYRDLLRSLPQRGLGGLEVHLNTNAQLWTPELWATLAPASRQVRTAHISVDAAAAATYERNRRGGSWETLQRNLAFVSGLRRSGALRFVTLSFVVQANNFREMPAFVELVERLGFDLVYFHKLCNWGSYSREEYWLRAVHEPSNPRHRAFRDLLAHEIFRRPPVGLFCLAPLRAQVERTR